MAAHTLPLKDGSAYTIGFRETDIYYGPHPTEYVVICMNCGSLIPRTMMGNHVEHHIKVDGKERA